MAPARTPCASPARAMAPRELGRTARARGLGAAAALVSLTGIVERIGRAAGPPAFRLTALRRVRVGAGILVEVLHQLAQRALVQPLGLFDMPVGILLPTLRQVLERLFAE